MKKFLFLIFTLLFSFYSHAASPSKAVIENLFNAMGIPTWIEKNLSTPLRPQISKILLVTLDFQDDIPLQKQERMKQIIDNFAADLVSSYIDDILAGIKNEYIKVSSTTLTQEELNSLIVFFSSPPGQSIAQKLGPGTMSLGNRIIKNENSSDDPAMASTLTPEEVTALNTYFSTAIGQSAAKKMEAIDSQMMQAFVEQSKPDPDKWQKKMEAEYMPQLRRLLFKELSATK